MDMKDKLKHLIDMQIDLLQIGVCIREIEVQPEFYDLLCANDFMEKHTILDIDKKPYIDSLSFMGMTIRRREE